MRTIIYVDGFNLFYGSLKGTPYKWLDLPRLCTEMLQPHHQITKVKFFTARLSRKSNPRKAKLQGIYLSALSRCYDSIEIYYGQFLTQTKVVNLVHPINGKRKAEVVNMEEKGTDVALASHLLDDAWRDNFDCAVVVSNDSDFAEAIRFVKRLKGKQVGIFIPYRKNRTRRSKQLLALANFNRDIRESILKRCQLPDRIPGTSIYRPKVWGFSQSQQ